MDVCIIHRQIEGIRVYVCGMGVCGASGECGACGACGACVCVSSCDIKYDT